MDSSGEHFSSSKKTAGRKQNVVSYNEVRDPVYPME
jgi:hypothetical protein